MNTLLIGKQDEKTKRTSRTVSNLGQESGRKGSGRASTWVIAVVATAGLIGLGLLGYFFSATGQRGPTAEVGPVQAGPALTPEQRPVLAAPSGGSRSTSAAEADLSLGAHGSTVPREEDRFVGTGKIRGHVELSGEGTFPTVWRLTLSPSSTLIGSHRAIEKVLDFDDGRQDFTLGDLPLGGYDISASADGMNGLPHPVLIEKRSPSVFINLRMVRAGFVTGTVLDATGSPAEGVVLTLMKLPALSSRTTTSDALGEYRFDPVLDGAYQLVVGRFESPLIKDPTTLRVQSPGMTLPDIELPPMAALELTVLDPADDRLLPDVLVRGSGTNGGSFEGRTDSFGQYFARHLPPGRWRVRLELEGHQGRRDSYDLMAGETERVNLALWYK